MENHDEVLHKAQEFFLDIVAAFYSDIELAIANALVHYKYLRDDDISDEKILKIRHKYAHRALYNLRDGSLVKSFQFNLRVRGNDKKIAAVDYDHVRNVVLYRLHSIYQIQVFNENFNRSNELERFECRNPACKKKYSLPEVAMNFNDKTNKYFCSYCHRDLDELKVDEGVTSQNLQDKLNKQTVIIMRHLEGLQNYTIHEQDPQQEIEKELKEQCYSGIDPEIRLAIAGNGGGGGRTRGDGYTSYASRGTEIRVNIVDEDSIISSKPRRLASTVPSFLVNSTVEETLQWQQREMLNEEQFYEDDDLVVC
ncbi:zinc finger domain-containing protein [Blastocystis sp. subtype 4]|uniref:zinc finger domain-containing protein n=1 Tax=Blastocystis sp. subtype 4 TaxID=944170 RepID=UPI0007117A40|nr:zinc finger domain-containing protein [Blastocystis sp. subtype 4]KNB43709.1 zinc finger domain-containing protein [Blastocystis sp. subtype 4]|eukprot:XP_014527152.1 zinc finger domain-containing protein [Blastocystis sp. subtype 4]